MFPLKKADENKHRKKKRKIEISLVVEIISEYFKDKPEFQDKRIRILEFGSGNGFQIPYLQKIGNLVASDIYISDDIKNTREVNFVKCNAVDIPFKMKAFDLIYSNHVIEHIKNKQGVFKELSRIGRPGCVYVFTVPTSIWLLLSIPAQYYNNFRSVFKKIFGTASHAESRECNRNHNMKDGNTGRNNRKLLDRTGKALRLLKPSGHGVESGFFNCFLSFRTGSWEKLFSDNGFSILIKRPLLLYGPSEWPIIPTTSFFNRFNITSSMLFLMKF